MRWRPNATSTTILHVCVIHDQPAIFEQLVTQHNAQLHLRNAWHQTPLLAAASQGSLQSFEMSLGCVGRTVEHLAMTPLEDTLTTAQTPSRHCSLPPWGALCT